MSVVGLWVELATSIKEFEGESCELVDSDDGG